MDDHAAFFYGTLMAPAVLHRVCHGTSQPGAFHKSLLKVRPAMLHSYRRHRVKAADYPAILPAENSVVRGTLVTGLTDGDIWRLDIFEGSEYERRSVSVKVLAKVGDDSGVGNVEGEEVEAETYVWIAGSDELEDEEWDFGEFVQEKMRRWVGSEGEGEYAEVDDAVRAQEKQGKDPTGGRGLNGSISKTLEENRERSKEILESAV